MRDKGLINVNKNILDRFVAVIHLVNYTKGSRLNNCGHLHKMESQIQTAHSLKITWFSPGRRCEVCFPFGMYSPLGA